MRASGASTSLAPEHLEAPARPLLSVVVPVYNGGEDIVANVETIRRAVAAGLGGEELELVVVSDGSIDGTAERLLEAQSDLGMHVIHYDRNAGKGYAVKAGALAADGRVDRCRRRGPRPRPRARFPAYLEIARSERLDFAIGSKRHPDSVVHYPRSRRAASWCYQQLNRVLFQLDVRDTQVGLKVFSREVAEKVVPLLLVKQFAFDLELLAVGQCVRLSPSPRATGPARLPLHRLRGAVGGGRPCALGHGSGVLSAPHPPDVPAPPPAPAAR